MTSILQQVYRNLNNYLIWDLRYFLSFSWILILKKCQKEYQLAESFELIMSTANTEFVPWREPKGFSEQQCYNKKGAKN